MCEQRCDVLLTSRKRQLYLHGVVISIREDTVLRDILNRCPLLQSASLPFIISDIAIIKAIDLRKGKPTAYDWKRWKSYQNDGVETPLSYIV